MLNIVNHDYHLVKPSPWPFLTAWSIFIMAMSFIFYIHEDNFNNIISINYTLLLIISFIVVIVFVCFWWKDILKEAMYDDCHTRVVQIHMRYGMIMFILSELMFFVTWFWVYFDAMLFPDEIIQYLRLEYTSGIWPPVSILTFDPWDIPFINTLILLLSGFSVTWAHHALINNDNKTVILGLFCAIVLGILFSIFQFIEYKDATFDFDSGLYASIFYMITGFHGFHVILGTIALTVMLIRAINGHFKPNHHFGFEAAAWYWHFVDIIWIFLFIFIYVLGFGNFKSF